MRSRYDLAEDSSILSDNDTPYKDICTIHMDKFRYTTAPSEYYITMIDVKRIDLMIFNLYGTAEFDDLLLWLNDIADPTTLVVGDKLLVPSKSDMETFYYVSRE